MKSLKIVTLLLIYTLLVYKVNAQITIKPYYKYSYDAAGNRTNRNYVKNPTTPPNGSRKENPDTTKVKEPEVYNEIVGKSELKIYPNPTKDIVNVDIINNAVEVNGTIAIYDNLGKKVGEQKMNGIKNIVDFKNRPSGMYILRILIGSEKSQWKVVKEL